MKTGLPDILYEDAAVVAFDKPSGLLVSPDRWDKDAGNLMDIVHRRMSPDIFNVHRLERETSGVVLCGKTRESVGELSRQFERYEVTKRYVAIVRPAPEWQGAETRLGIGEDETTAGKMKVFRHGGKEAETRFSVLERWRACALLEAFPRTGRTHQIRVHLAALGCPLVADPLYGDGCGILLSELKSRFKRKDGPERPLLGRLALHAESITFVHPGSGQSLTVRCPMPDDFGVAIKYLSRFHGGWLGQEKDKEGSHGDDTESR